MRSLPKRLYRFQFASLFSQLSYRCLQLAMAWWILDKSADASTYALVISISTAIEICSRLAFAWLGDRYDKFAIYRLGCLANFLAIITLAILNLFDVYHILLVAFFLGVVGISLGIRSPIATSAISQLVEVEQISTAVQLKNVFYSLASVAGPGLAGVLIAIDGTRSALIIGSLLIFCSILLITNLVASERPDSSQSSAPANQTQPTKKLHSSWWMKTVGGIKLLYRVKAEFFLALVAMVINLCLFPFFTILIPVLVKETLQLDAWYIGLLDGSFSVGILLGSSIVVALVTRRMGKRHAAALGIVLLALAMIACALVNNLYLVAPVMFLGGLGLMLFNINVSVPRLIATPEAFKNRMVASVLFFSSIANPVGAYFSGVLVDAIGVHATLIGFAAITVASAGLLYISADLWGVLDFDDAKLDNLYGKLYPKAFT